MTQAELEAFLNQAVAYIPWPQTAKCPRCGSIHSHLVHFYILSGSRTLPIFSRINCPCGWAGSLFDTECGESYERASLRVLSEIHESPEWKDVINKHLRRSEDTPIPPGHVGVRLDGTIREF